LDVPKTAGSESTLRISRPVIVENGSEICISASVEIRYDLCSFPDTLWFKFPAAYRDYLSDRADGFAVSLLPLAMTVGEDLTIEGPLSPRLLRGMHEYQEVQHAWQPKLFDVVNLEYEALEKPAACTVSGASACSFSGGVDSFYTLWQHLPRNEKIPGNGLTHALMINGFDLDADLENIGSNYRFFQVYQPIIDRSGMELLVSTTNIMHFIDAKILKGAFGAVLTSSAMVLGRLFSSFLIPSSYPFTCFFPDGSHLLLDPLLSTETMEVTHDAPTVSRIDKTEALAKWPETHAALRVCPKPVEAESRSRLIENCCRCEKCIRTMAALRMAGQLSAYNVFPKPLSLRHICRPMYRYYGSRIFAGEIVRRALKTGHISLFSSFLISLFLSHLLAVLIEPFHVLHLAIEKRSRTYSRFVQRHHPRLKKGTRNILKIPQR
jgi:hypothetical protein